MSANLDKRLISFDDAAALLGGIHPNSIRQRKAGTEDLTHVPGFGRRVFLVRSEVEELITKKIEQAKAKHRKERNGLYAVQ